MGAYTLPAARRTTWNPGLNAYGGIPSRTSIYTTLSPSGDSTGATDTTAIQNAINAAGSTKLYTLPARARYEAGTPMPLDGATIGVIGYYA